MSAELMPKCLFEDGAWRIRDLHSANGLYSGGRSFDQAAIAGQMAVRLGIYGPELLFEVVEAPTHSKDSADDETVVERYIEHYFGKDAAHEPVGEHTMFVRKAFRSCTDQAETKVRICSRRLLICHCGAQEPMPSMNGSRFKKQRAMAEDLFYAMKSLDVDIANLERAVLSSNNQQSTRCDSEV